MLKQFEDIFEASKDAIGYAALDIFMCGSAEPDHCIPVLREAFAAERVGVNELLRGQHV